MPTEKRPPQRKEHQFFLNYDSIEEFDGVFDRKGAETGMFLNPTLAMEVGDRVLIQVTIKGFTSPVNLEGRLMWRRLRAGGPDLPAGAFVGLLERDRARLDGIGRYLRTRGNKDRRTCPRLHVSIPTRYHTAQGDFQSEARDLSRGGAFLRSSGPLLPVGARFPVDFFLDGRDAKATTLSVQVAWIDLFEDTQGMGVVFENKGSRLRKIRRFLEQLEKKRRKHRDESS